MTPANVPTQVRLLAFVLGLGAVIGVLGSAFAVIRVPWAVFQQVSVGLWVLTFISEAVFGLCFWLALRLFDGNPQALNLAKFTFLAQIPKVAFPGFFYQFQTLGCTIELSSVKKWHVGFDLGSGVGALISPQVHDYTFGVNVVALAAERRSRAS